MATAAEIRARVEEKYPAYPVEFDTETVKLQSILTLSDEKLEAFTKASAKLAKLDEENDVRALKDAFVDALSDMAENPASARPLLVNESLGFLTEVFTEYGKGLADAAKSEDPA